MFTWITACCNFRFQVPDVCDFKTPNITSPLGLRKERQQIYKARRSNWIEQTANGGCAFCVIVAGTSEGKEGQEWRTKRDGGRVGGAGGLFRILCAIRHVPCARCEEVTLRPHVPHPLLPADRCAEHGLQEYGPAADKGHTEEPSNLVHAECTCRHWEKQTHCNQTRIVWDYIHTHSTYIHLLSSTVDCRLHIICNVCVQTHK